MGYNGFARGVDDTPERYLERELKYRLIVHCERNALLFADTHRLKGATLYTWPFMSCSVCAGMVIQSGIRRCVAPFIPEDKRERWEADMKLATQQFQEAGVELCLLDGRFEFVSDFIDHHNMKIVASSGHFDPLHEGHLRYLEAASRLGDFHVVIVNSDAQLCLKGRQPLLNEQQRLEVIRSLKFVDAAVLSVDQDRSVAQTLQNIRPAVFANGGDVVDESQCREAMTCRFLGIQMVFGVGGSHKIASSSELLGRFVKSS